MDVCNGEIEQLYSVTEASMFPSLDDHFPDHTDPLTFRGRLADGCFVKTLINFHAIVSEVSETIETCNSDEVSETDQLHKRLRFLPPVAKIIHSYLPFPTPPRLRKFAGAVRSAFRGN